ncbi:MAG TPA: PIN domain-containing protein [Candidatus Acidoferrales bacterium]|nr:PIN domain-containing protein [Candidatus Acidoferrales bacterium]
MGLIADLKPGPVALDSRVFIHFIEEERLFLPLVKPLFQAIDRGDLVGVTSGLSLMEVLVGPYRSGNSTLAERYEALLTNSRGLRFIEVDRRLLKAAAQLRATLKLKPPDAIQVAAALVGDCTAFLTNDRRIPAVPGLKVLQLKAYL